VISYDLGGGGGGECFNGSNFFFSRTIKAKGIERSNKTKENWAAGTPQLVHVEAEGATMWVIVQVTGALS